MEDFVKAAVGQGFISYGVSSHAPLPFETSWNLKRESVQEYLAEIQRLKILYGDRIELYAGMEIDYLEGVQSPDMPYFQELPLDYRIGSVHLVHTPAGKIVDTDTNPKNFRRILIEDFQGDLRKLVTAYFEASLQLLEAGGFDFVGHPNKIHFNAAQCERSVTSRTWYAGMLEDFFALAARKGYMVEINTKAYLQKGCFYPAVEDFALIRKWNLPIVVNSDAHRPEGINAGREEALKKLKETGFTSVRQLHQGKWQEVKIQ